MTPAKAYAAHWDRLDAGRRVIQCGACNRTVQWIDHEAAHRQGWAWRLEGGRRVWTCKECVKPEAAEPGFLGHEAGGAT